MRLAVEAACLISPCLIHAPAQEIKARKAAGAALKGIANKRAPTTLGVAKRGVTKAGARGAAVTAQGGASVIKRTARGTSVATAKTSLARKIVSRARTAKAKLQQAPKTLVAAVASKQQVGLGRGVIAGGRESCCV